MFIWWGSRIKRRRVGTVADYCRTCHDIRGFALYRVGRAAHFYGISFGAGTLIGHEIHCGSCGVALGTNPATYPNVSNIPNLSNNPGCQLEDLIQETHPDVRKRYAPRLELDERARKGRLSAQERQALIRELVGLVNNKLEQRVAQTHFDRYSGLGCLGTIVLIIAMTSLLSNYPNAMGWAVVLTGGVGFLFVVIVLATDARRFARREIYPLLAHSLAILSPTEAELDAALQQSRAVGQAAGKRLRAKELFQSIRALQATSEGASR